MPNLLPVGYETEVIDATDLVEQGPIGYRNGPAFDYETGDYKRDGKNRVIDSDGIESWKAWCINCISTERYACLAYPLWFGIETGPVFAAESREEAENLLTREITEALLADEYQRTEYIEDISFNWTAPDTVEVSLTVRGLEDVSIDITAYITQRT